MKTLNFSAENDKKKKQKQKSIFTHMSESRLCLQYTAANKHFVDSEIIKREMTKTITKRWECNKCSETETMILNFVKISQQRLHIKFSIHVTGITVHISNNAMVLFSNIWAILLESFFIFFNTLIQIFQFCEKFRWFLCFV